MNHQQREKDEWYGFCENSKPQEKAGEKPVHRILILIKGEQIPDKQQYPEGYQDIEVTVLAGLQNGDGI